MTTSPQTLAEWVPNDLTVRVRRGLPNVHEAAPAAGAAAQFAGAVNEMVKRIDSDPQDPALKAHAVISAAAVVNDHVTTTSNHLAEQITPNQQADPEPETLKARDLMNYCQGLSDGIQDRANELFRNLPEQPEPPSPETIRAMAEAAANTGHAAALNWHLDALADPDISALAKAGHVLAMWTSQNYATRQCATYGESPEPAADHRQAALLDLHATIRRMMDPDNLNLIEENRPVFASTSVVRMHARQQLLGLASALPAPTPDSDARFDWQDGHTDDATMAYRYEGCAYVKLVSEAYQHPIDTPTVLKHCNALEDTILKMLDVPDQAGHPEQDVRPLLHQAVLNRSMALAGLHTVPALQLHRAIRVLAATLPERTRVQAVLRAICDDHAETVTSLTNLHGLHGAGLSEQQCIAAVSAAGEAGASPHALRDMGIRLGLEPSRMAELGVPQPERVEWPAAENILEHLYSVQPDKRIWSRAASIMGWERHDQKIQGLWLQLEIMGQRGSDYSSQSGHQR